MSHCAAAPPGLRFTREWRRCVEDVRGHSMQLALDVFAGTCIVTSIILEMGFAYAPPIEILISPWMDLFNAGFLCV